MKLNSLTTQPICQKARQGLRPVGTIGAVILLLLGLQVDPALGAPDEPETQIRNLARRPLGDDDDPRSLSGIIHDVLRRAEAGGDEAWEAILTSLEHAEFGRLALHEVLRAAVSAALARQLYCLSSPEIPVWDDTLSELTEEELVYLRDRLLTRLAKEALTVDLRLLQEGESDARPDGRPTRILITREPLRNGVQRPGEEAAAAPGWPSLQRALVALLADAANGEPQEEGVWERTPDFSDRSSDEWRELEDFLWHLWQSCDALADFGDARWNKLALPEKGYPTDLFNFSKITRSRQGLSEQDLLSEDLVLVTEDALEVLGAHHLISRQEWLGQEVDRELDAPLDDDRWDTDDEDGVEGNVFRDPAEIIVTVSVAEQGERYAAAGDPDPDGDGRLRTDLGELVLYAWVDWGNTGRFDPDDIVEWIHVRPEVANGRVQAQIKNKKRVQFYPNNWGQDPETGEDITSRRFILRIRPKQDKPQGWARFRLFYFNNRGPARHLAKRPDNILPSGQALFGEVEDYRIGGPFEGTGGEQGGDLLSLFDPRGDWFRHYSSLLASAPGWSDVQQAWVEVVTPTVGPWSDINIPQPGEPIPDGRVLTLEMDLYEPIPAPPDADFASWHFVVDLDGRRSTGHPGGEVPVGVFPELGVDLWADLIWDGHGLVPYLFLGAEGVSRLAPTSGLLAARLSEDRKSVLFEVPIEPLEEVLTGLTGEPFAVDENGLRWVAVTNHVSEPLDYEDPPSDFFPDRFYLPPGSCARAAFDGSGLCVTGERFKVEVAWETPRGRRGGGRTLPLSGDSGAFWFFDPDNVELLVKVLDACSYNGRFWVFAAGLTNVETEITVTDTATGERRRYLNPQGTPFEPILDTAGFATCEAPDGRRGAGEGGGGLLAEGAAEAAGSGRAPSPRSAGAAAALQLAGGRYRVEVAWETPRGRRGGGQALPLTDDSGAFWFFGPDNVELLVKVLDACSYNGRFWVFAAGLTNVEVELTVTDTVTGALRTYRNPQRTPFQPLLDTGAFACG